MECWVHPAFLVPRHPCVGLGVPYYRFEGVSYLLGAVSMFLENDGEKFQFLREGILVKKSFGFVYQGSQD
jgi:hypothetical protein